MIAALLPYLKWMLEAKHGNVATAQVLAAQLWSNDAFWDPKEECIRNKSDEMLTVALSDTDGLYWEAEVQEPVTPKWKKIKVGNELVMDSILMVKWQ